MWCSQTTTLYQTRFFSYFIQVNRLLVKHSLNLWLCLTGLWIINEGTISANQRVPRKAETGSDRQQHSCSSTWRCLSELLSLQVFSAAANFTDTRLKSEKWLKPESLKPVNLEVFYVKLNVKKHLALFKVSKTDSGSHRSTETITNLNPHRCSVVLKCFRGLRWWSQNAGCQENVNEKLLFC